MKYRFINARILTMQDNCEIFEGELTTSDDRITYVGAYRENEADSDYDRVIDCEGDVLMPGFKNVHTHSGMTLFRSLADDCPLSDWLNDYIFPREAKLCDRDVYVGAKLAILEYLTSGVTTISDMYIKPVPTKEACTDMGMRCVHVGSLNNFTLTPEQMEELYQSFNAEGGLNTYRLGFHAEYTTSKELMLQVAELVDKYKTGIYMHISETKSEVEDCIKRYGKTPVALMEEIGLLKYGGAGYHCVHFNSEDMDIFKKNKMYVVTNPGSNTKLASGIAPLRSFIDKGISVCIGTDGASSNNCLDMFREMFLAAGLAKLREKDAAAIDAMEILKMATVNGAYAVGLTDCDTLAENKKADIIRIDMKQPNMYPIYNIPKNLVYSGSKQNVYMTMIDGKILYENNVFYTSCTPKEIYDEIEIIKNRL